KSNTALHHFISTEKPTPTVSVTPRSSVYTGDRVTLSCNLMSTGWTFLWYEGQKVNPLSSQESNTNTHTVTVSKEGGVNYYCKARRGDYDSEISDPATITVRARPKPAVSVQAADPDNVFTGETVTFSCEIKTTGSWQYHWFRDNNELSDAAGKKTFKISDVKKSNNGAYTCSGTQSSDPKYTQTSDAVTLTVSEKPKPELTSSLKGAVLTGNSVTLSCILKPQSAGWKFYWSIPTQSSETESHSYTISSVSVSDRGQYKCIAGRGNPVYYTDYSNPLSLTVIGENIIAMGVMPRKSTTDAIFALRILMEKYRDGQRELHCVFVDLEKAYDRVPREELWYSMKTSGVAEKYVRVVQDMYERSRTVVRCAVGQTEEFKVEVGLHQGSALSPFLFAIVMDQLSEEVRQQSSWTMMFADDIVICSESTEQVEENLERWRFALERRGMKVSRSKTEYMCVNEREESGTVRLQGEEVKKVQEFKYLGSTVQSNGECGKEPTHRDEVPSLDPKQFTDRPNRSIDDVITTTFHLAITHLDNKDSYVSQTGSGTASPAPPH
ncbi:hypothetical protein QTP70_018857, partial [Hemibagrus guttatus]